MAVSVDTYDEENGIHPRYKQVEKQKEKKSQFQIFLATPLSVYDCHFTVFSTVSNLPKFTFMIQQTQVVGERLATAGKIQSIVHSLQFKT